MSVEKAKEFLVDTTENEEAAARIQSSYLATLVEVSREMGYDLTEDDIVVAIEEMSGLGVADHEPEAEGFAGRLVDSLTFSSPLSFGVIANPLRLGGLGGPGGRGFGNFGNPGRGF